MNKTSENLKIQKVIAVIAIVLFCLKIFAWYVTNSVAILSDALESIVNILASFMGIYSLILSAKPKDKNHLYGHGKVEFISSGIEGTLIIMAGIFIIYKSILRFNEPSEINKIDIGLILLAFTALVNWFAGTICVKKGKNSNSLVLIASGKHLQSDTITTAGIFVGLLLMYFLGYVWLDSLVAALFSLIIIYSGVKIIRSSVAGIMDETDIRLLGRLVETLNNNRSVNWMDIHNMRIIKYGATLHLDCHLTVPWYFNVNEAHAELDKV
ncbi:MAG: cation transporter, partial [Bacteroidetes bacterium]|nr:cation transporter [Bacteroidota bacterium]